MTLRGSLGAGAMASALALVAGCEKPTAAPPPAGKGAASAALPAAASSAASGVGAASAAGSTAPPAASGSASGGGASAAGKAPPYNVLVLSIDSLRADMPWAGYPREIAPRLTELEKRSVSYTQAYAISSYTSMSLGGFLGGKLPSEMARSGFFFGKYPKEDVLFPEILQAHGIRTLAAHAHGYFKDAGFEQGFDRYEIVADIVFKNETDPNVTSPAHEALAEKQLGDPELETKRFFAWYHFLDPHDMYMGHEKDGIPAYGPKARDKYDAEVTFTDRWIGKLLDFVAAKPWGERTVIVVTADHGEAFGEHGQFAHGFELWQNLVRVPLFLRVPGVAPRRIDVPRSTIDLAPTILDLLDVKDGREPLALEGTSLVPELLGGPAPERDVLLDLPMTSDSDKRRALVHGHQKIVAFGKEESLKLFDLEADPEEKHPILQGDVFREMAQRLRERERDIKEVAPYACAEKCLNRAYVKAGGK